MKMMTSKVKEFYDPRRDGVTQGLLTMWRECREKAWLFLQGWSPKATGMSMVNGVLIHGVLERAYEDIRKKVLKGLPSKSQVQNYIRIVERIWEKDNPRADKKTLEHKETALLLAEITLPIYFEFWHKDFKEMKWLGLETQFDHTERFVGGTTMRFRGKMDGLYEKSGLWLFETKSKSRIEEGNLIDMLSLDFQLLLYIWSIWKKYNRVPKGAKYNIVRRIGLEQRKTETTKQYVQRCVEDIRKRPEFYFIRYEIGIDAEELLKFEQELRAQVQEFLDWWDEKLGHYRSPNQCETKYGRCWGLNICASGNFSQYERRKVVFRELEDF